jgi:tricorn protease
MDDLEHIVAEVERDALVVDVRFNGGGHVSQLVLEKLARRRIGYDISRWGTPDPYPSDSPAGPLVALTNEHAGSDGDIFSHCFKLFGLGPVVGKRTWGGVIGISPRHALVDGSLTTQPEYAFWFSDVGWGVENYGTEPDVDVDIRPQDYAAGRDPQLDKAVALALEALKKHKPLQADVDRRPSLVLPELPPRPQQNGTKENGPKKHGNAPAAASRARPAWSWNSVRFRAMSARGRTMRAMTASCAPNPFATSKMTPSCGRGSAMSSTSFSGARAASSSVPSPL